MRRVYLVTTVTILLVLKVEEGLGGISISHKLLRNKEVIAEVPFEQILHYSGFQEKTTLVTGDPDDACGDLNSPPPVQKESLHAKQILNRWTILVKHSDRCTWRSRITRALAKGYVEVLAYSKNSEAEDEIRSTDWESLNGLEINVSVVSGYDAEILKKYSYPKPYTISFRKDSSYMDEIKTHSRTLSILWLLLYTGMFITVPLLVWKKWGNLDEISWPGKTTLEWTFGNKTPEEPQNQKKKNERSQRKKEESSNSEKHRRQKKRRERRNHSTNMDESSNRLSLEGYRNLLGVAAEATLREIESAYRRKSQEYYEDWTRRHGFSEEEIKRRTEILKTELPEAREALVKECES